MTSCQMCSEAPAAVSTPNWALCRACYRSIQADIEADNAITNYPYCPQCGGPEHGDHACHTDGVLVLG